MLSCLLNENPAIEYSDLRVRIPFSSTPRPVYVHCSVQMAGTEEYLLR